LELKAMPSRKILLAGESWVTYKVEAKGFSSYATSTYGEGQAEIVAALKTAGHEVTFIPNHLAVNDFPWNVEALAPYDVVMLSDISADTLQIHPDCFDRCLRTPDRLRVIRDWVKLGGGLVMVGGYLSFSGLEGKGHYQATPLADALPVEMLGYDDRIETPEGVTPVVGGTHAILNGVQGDWPHFLGYNRLKAKADAQVLMSVENDPFLIVGNFGRGRAAAFASDCSAHWGSPEFLAWEHYGRFWGQLVDWLGVSSTAEKSADQQT
jgi:uncharacterized membrane protein